MCNVSWITQNICAVLAPEVVRRCHGDFLKEKGQITRLPKDATPKKIFFSTKTSGSSQCFHHLDDFYPKTESSSQWVTCHCILDVCFVNELF